MGNVMVYGLFVGVHHALTNVLVGIYSVEESAFWDRILFKLAYCTRHPVSQQTNRSYAAYEPWEGDKRVIHDAGRNGELSTGMSLKFIAVFF